MNLKELDVKIMVGFFFGSVYGPLACHCEQSTDVLVSRKDKHLEWLCGRQVLETG